MSSQIPLMLSEDAYQVIDRVERIYNGRLRLSELLTCWRPPSPMESKRPWPDKRLWAAIEEAVASGVIDRVKGFCGDVLMMKEDPKP